MKKKTNLEIREASKKTGIPLWRLAVELGISVDTLCRRRSFEFSPEEKRNALRIIEKLAAEESTHE